MTRKWLRVKKELKKAPKYRVLSIRKLILGTNTLEAGKWSTIDQKTAEFLKWSVFAKKWTITVEKNIQK